MTPTRTEKIIAEYENQIIRLEDQIAAVRQRINELRGQKELGK